MVLGTVSNPPDGVGVHRRADAAVRVRYQRTNVIPRYHAIHQDTQARPEHLRTVLRFSRTNCQTPRVPATVEKPAQHIPHRASRPVFRVNQKPTGSASLPGSNTSLAVKQ